MEEEKNIGVGSFNIIESLYQPIKDQEKLFGDRKYNFFKENNVDPAELIGIQRDPNAAVVQLNKDDPKNKEINFEYVKDVYNFVADLPDQALYRLVLGGMNATKLGVNLLPAFSRLLGSEPGEDRFDDMYKFSQQADENIKNKITMFKDIYASAFKTEKGRDPNKASDFASYIAQDYPYFAPIYSTLDKIGLPKTISVPLSVGLSSGVAFDPKQQTADGQSESSFFFDSASIKSLKEFFGALPNTPEGEVFDRAYQAFETTGVAAAIGPIINTALFLKRNVPAFNKAIPGTAVATGSATAIGEITDQTILNPQDQTMQNQEPTILDNVRSGIDQFGNKLTEIGGAIKKEFSGEAMANPLIKKGVDELAPKLAPIFKSTVIEAVEKIPNKAPGNQILGTIKNIPGVTQTEMKWIGLDDFLKDKPSVSKQEVSDFIQANKIDVTEVQLKGSVNLPEELLERKKIFEEKITTGNESYPNSFISYDTYNIDIDRSGGFMDFRTLNQILGDNPNINNFKKLPNGNLTGTDNINVGTFEISPIDFEKYQIENDVRKFLSTQNKAKFERFTEPGGEDYTELVFKIAGNKMPVIAKIQNSLGVTPTTFDKKITTPYSSSDRHFGQKNEFAHVRFKSRYDGGLKILSVEEMQSDIANQFQKNELATNYGSKVLDFPFKNNWYEFVIKRLTRYAADNNFDAIAIPKASVPAKRYGESINEVTNLKIDVTKKPKGTAYYNPLSSATEVNPDTDKYFFNIAFKDPQLKTVKYETFEQQDILKILDNYKVNKNIKENVENILAGKKEINNTFEFGTTPVEKKIIGEGAGKYELYDKVIPSYLKKYAKKWNAEVYDESLDKFDYKLPVTILKITPEMKRSVQDKSQPLFNIVLPALSAGGGAKVISDNMENNTISNPTKN